MTDVTCASGVELLMEHLEGVLPPEVSADLQAHVAGCVRCTAFARVVPGDPPHPEGGDGAHAPVGASSGSTSRSDNWSIHQHPDVLQALTQYPRLHPIWLPIYAPWLTSH